MFSLNTVTEAHGTVDSMHKFQLLYTYVSTYVEPDKTQASFNKTQPK